MSLIAEVCDLDNLRSFNPLAFDFGNNLVRGADAILRRVLYLWSTPLFVLRHAPGLGVSVPVTELAGTTYAPMDLAGLRSSLETQAKQVAFVDECEVTITPLAGGRLLIAATITLTDNKAYALELSVSAARVALLALGSQTA